MRTEYHLDAYDVEDEMHYVAWCDECLTLHWHSPEEGHRAAHCTSASVYKNEGYYIDLMGVMPKQLAQRISRAARPATRSRLYEAFTTNGNTCK